MHQAFLRRLCCCRCRGDLALEARRREGQEILEGTLTCRSCSAAYPITNGVPRFVLPDLAPEVRHTARNFGASWKIWHGIDDGKYERQLFDWLPDLSPRDVRGKRLLDAGCGKGRHLRIMARLGAAEIVGVDLSDAVDVARANTRGLANVHIVQADVHHLPLRGGFDLAYSVGVLHHVPDPGRAFDAVVDQVRPGGTAACWVYGRESNGWIVCLVNPLRTMVTRHLPPAAVRAIAFVMGAVLQLVIHGIYIPAEALGLKLFYHRYMKYLGRLGFREVRHVVYDHLIAPTAFYLRRDQVRAWLDEAGLVDQRIAWVNGNSWSAVGRRTGEVAAPPRRGRRSAARHAGADEAPNASNPPPGPGGGLRLHEPCE